MYPETHNVSHNSIFLVNTYTNFFFLRDTGSKKKLLMEAFMQQTFFFVICWLS